MEQNAKKFEELNKYERAMATATLEQRLEAMARDLQQMTLALGMSIHINATIYDTNRSGVDINLFPRNGECIIKSVREEGDLFGSIEEALSKKDSE